ncbi:ParB-like nuclease domain-containing protein [Bradyrhizobium sp. Ghvi]|uniref:ParB/RepB/Spo0J family partition protein n=1 Tax=Bradyrhizobium sp. Ghvi TaxID=1855319 RepID=UPI0008EAD4FA|nr:ParB/RepB/Spo0J family partition protein [Bradyrhizobium sp. Ghvi]SFN95722.1 ParB-like nuclease domain-containing protein [Bradyrhizobium sp. Ghvi]
MAKKKFRSEHTAATLDVEVKKATEELQQPAKGDERDLKLPLDDIETRPELFQPRIFSHGMKEVDERNVHDLLKIISAIGELDPITVVKLDNRWTCVDGHHRLECYRRLKWKDPIKANWFAGSVREALDYAVTSNEVIKLAIPDRDRYELAWQRVVLGWGSKAEIARFAMVSERLVANMRMVKAKFEKGDAFAKEFRLNLGAELKDVSWRRAKMAHDGATPGEIDKHEVAVRLAKVIRNRMHHKLSEDPEVTALALALYDPHLPQPLGELLRKYTTKEGDLEVPTVPKASIANMSDRELLETVERIAQARQTLLRSQREAEAEQERRNAGWTPSDDTWDQWVQEAGEVEE